MHITLKRFMTFSLILLICGAVAFGVGLLLGGDPLDGLAGGPTTNSDLENLLLEGGYFVALAGLVPTLVGLVIVYIKRFKTSKNFALSSLVFLFLMAAIPVRNNYFSTDFNTDPPTRTEYVATYPQIVAAKKYLGGSSSIPERYVYRNILISAFASIIFYIFAKRYKDTKE